MPEQTLTYYLEKYAQGNLGSEEKQLLLQMLKEPANQALANQLLDSDWELWKNNGMDFSSEVQRIQSKVAAAIELEAGKERATVTRKLSSLQWKWAAAIVVLVGAAIMGLVMFSHKPSHPSSEALVSETSTQMPDNHAVLTLSDGKKITLDNVANGAIAQQGNTSIHKMENGEIIYKPSNTNTASLMMNTVSTPKGKDYKVQLPDGTLVWLNAASSLSFPASFTGDNRAVSLSGEAYFEVAKDRSKPFIVRTSDAAIEVLGTHFNVSDYAEDNIGSVSLLEGSIRFTRGKESEVLRPGEKVQFVKGSNTLSLMRNIEEEQVLAWKNGNFYFKEQDIETVMNQIGRWFDLEIVYEGKKPDIKMWGMMGRDTDLEVLLKSLERTSGIKFSVEKNAGRPGRIYVKQ